MIGWLVTWARLAAARLPIDSSLPMIDDKVILLSGARTVLVMAIVFAAMCAVAYAVYLGRWNRHAEKWTKIVETSRTKARLEQLDAEPPPQKHTSARPKEHRSPPKSLRWTIASIKARSLAREKSAKTVDPKDALVRVIAGFNVGVLAVALGLIGARFAKTLIDQWHPGYWWALLAPWAVFSVLLAWVLGKVDPLKGGRFVHGVLWALVIAVAMVSSAPIGLLVLTWIGVGTFGRWYGSRSLPGSKLDFLRSPLPWILLTVYALVALSYAAMPPVTFSQTVLETTSGSRLGGYLGRTGSGVYLASCTPLADATSIDDRVQFVPTAQIKSLTATDTPFKLDSGYRPSLPALAFRAFGVDVQPPSWFRPELKARRGPCAGMPPPRPSIGVEQPQLGPAVYAAPEPASVRAHGGEPPIEQETPTIAELARRFQPTLLVTVADRFWPVSVGALLEDIGSGGSGTCLYRRGLTCASNPPVTLGDLKARGSTSWDYLQFPATPALAQDPTGQFEAFLRGQRGRNNRMPTLHEWLADPGTLDPWATAQIYFYYAGRVDPSTWPAPIKTIGNKLVALEYWFYYPYNYYPTIATHDLMNDAPIAGDVANTDLHQGDWEHVDVLIDPISRQPRWLYMARHSQEGEYFAWNSPLLSFDGAEHPVVQAAYGGHPTYDAHCAGHPRYIKPLNGIVSDWVVCGSGRFAFRAQSTPLVDIAATPWACWKGHFGVAASNGIHPPGHNENSVQRAIETYYRVPGPRSPLWQAENGHLSADGEDKPESGACLNNGDPRTAEREAIKEGIGRPTPRLRGAARAIRSGS